MASIATVFIALLALFVVIVAAMWLLGERGHLLLPSTRRMMPQRSGRATSQTAPPANARAPGAGAPFSILKQLEGYVYGRWTNQYIRVLIHKVIPRLSPDGKQRLADQYHGKVLTQEQARQLIQIDKPIRRDLEQIIPYPMARELILNAPVAVAAYECACRHASATPCQPTQVCMVMGDGPVSFVLEHNPQSSRRLTQDEALQLLSEEHARGHLHSAWFKDAMQGRFYAICNCCKCCCGGIRSMKYYGMPAVASSGFVVAIDNELCSACGVCAEKCPFDSLTVNGSATSNWEKCMGCGVCVDQCATGALSLVRDERKGVPLDVGQLVN